MVGRSPNLKYKGASICFSFQESNFKKTHTESWIRVKALKALICLPNVLFQDLQFWSLAGKDDSMYAVALAIASLGSRH